MKKEIPWDKVGKYISGEASSKQRKEVEAWIEADPDHAELFEELKDIWESKQEEEWDVDLAWENISGKLIGDRETSLRLVNLSGDQVKKTGYSSKTNRNKIWGYRVAVSLILIVGVLLTLILSLEQPTSEEPPAMQELIVERGQRSQFKLSDGTQVWLNSDSRLEVPARFSGDFREVHLEGEAFFDVAENPDKPFLIHARESFTKVLGTQFNLQAYPGEQVQIVVKEGRVAFGGSHQMEDESSELVKNQRAVLSDTNHLTINEVNDLERYIGWTEGRLVFRDTPLKEVAKKLERRYDIECTIEELALEDRTVTATFKKESIIEVLEIITLSVGISYEKDKQYVRFLNKESKQVFN
ncbi:FecR domain-containing protein [Fodinibius roseus]|nr:FecR domain-containing protein [Fodinibius roseus]